jgi:hypothetical protein
MHDWEIVASAHIVDIFGVAMPPCDEARLLGKPAPLCHNG